MKKINVYSFDNEFRKYYKLSEHVTKLGALISSRKHKKRGHQIYIGESVSVIFKDDLVDLTQKGGKA